MSCAACGGAGSAESTLLSQQVNILLLRKGLDAQRASADAANQLLEQALVQSKAAGRGSQVDLSV